MYPNGHTLSLHDALPICLARRQRPSVALRADADCRVARQDRADLDVLDAGLDQLVDEHVAHVVAGLGQDRALRVDDRSDEHTSELQSLMRTSYAVFCLKKKQQHPHTKQKHHTTTI